MAKLPAFGRKEFIIGGMAAGGAMLSGAPASAETVMLPFTNGVRQLAAYPQKRPLIVMTTMPVQLETPLAIFNEGEFTPNDAFFVRWHLAGVPTDIDAAAFHISVHGLVNTPLQLSVADLKSYDAVEIAAVCECSGNSRGFFNPRVPGGEWANGAMGNALWKGARLKDILAKAGVKDGAVQVRFNGADTALVPATPKFMKSLDMDLAMSDDVLLAYSMNGADLPVLNGYPVRLIVPGYFGTYWVKMLNDIEVLDQPDTNYWMKTAYTIPNTAHASITPGQTGVEMVPISRMVPRSFITNIKSGDTVRAGVPTLARGIAFGGDAGVSRVDFSSDGGKSWQETQLGTDEGKYSFRQWQIRFSLPAAGNQLLMVRCTSSSGETQPDTPNWNPAGFMRNVIEQTAVVVA